MKMIKYADIWPPCTPNRSADDGKRFCDLIARGTLYEGWLRRITYIILNCAREKGVAGRTGAEAGG